MVLMGQVSFVLSMDEQASDLFLSNIPQLIMKCAQRHMYINLHGSQHLNNSVL